MKINIFLQTRNPKDIILFLAVFVGAIILYSNPLNTVKAYVPECEPGQSKTDSGKCWNSDYWAKKYKCSSNGRWVLDSETKCPNRPAPTPVDPIDDRDETPPGGQPQDNRECSKDASRYDGLCANGIDRQKWVRKCSSGKWESWKKVDGSCSSTPNPDTPDSSGGAGGNSRLCTGTETKTFTETIKCPNFENGRKISIYTCSEGKFVPLDTLYNSCTGFSTSKWPNTQDSKAPCIKDFNNPSKCLINPVTGKEQLCIPDLDDGTKCQTYGDGPTDVGIPCVRDLATNRCAQIDGRSLGAYVQCLVNHKFDQGAYGPEDMYCSTLGGKELDVFGKVYPQEWPESVLGQACVKDTTGQCKKDSSNKPVLCRVDVTGKCIKPIWWPQDKEFTGVPCARDSLGKCIVRYHDNGVAYTLPCVVNSFSDLSCSKDSNGNDIIEPSYVASKESSGVDLPFLINHPENQTDKLIDLNLPTLTGINSIGCTLGSKSQIATKSCPIGKSGNIKVIQLCSSRVVDGNFRNYWKTYNDYSDCKDIGTNAPVCGGSEFLADNGVCYPNSYRETSKEFVDFGKSIVSSFTDYVLSLSNIDYNWLKTPEYFDPEKPVDWRGVSPNEYTEQDLKDAKDYAQNTSGGNDGGSSGGGSNSTKKPKNSETYNPPVGLGFSDGLIGRNFTGWVCDTNNPTNEFGVYLFATNYKGSEVCINFNNEVYCQLTSEKELKGRNSSVDSYCPAGVDNKFSIKVPNILNDNEKHNILAVVKINNQLMPLPNSSNANVTYIGLGESPKFSNPAIRYDINLDGKSNILDLANGIKLLLNQ